jgi:hypothetical protein
MHHYGLSASRYGFSFLDFTGIYVVRVSISWFIFYLSLLSYKIYYDNPLSAARTTYPRNNMDYWPRCLYDHISS